MALLNTFNFTDRTQNRGKHTSAPLLVRFVSDGVFRHATSSTANYALCERWLTKSYRWSGYTLDVAKRIANFYTNGQTGTRPGYCRAFREYYFDQTLGWQYDTTFLNRSVISVEHVGGNMYAVNIELEEVDQFLVEDFRFPTTYDEWCGAFARAYPGKAWADVNFGSDTPYSFEAFYDEPLTRVK